MTPKLFLARFAAVLAVLGALAFGFTPAADAAVQQASAPAVVQISDGADQPKGACGNGQDKSGADKSPLLPVSRWRDATAQMHGKLDNTFLQDQMNITARQFGTSWPIAMGNMMWDLASGVTAFSVNYCILDSAGGVADQMAGTIGKAVEQSPLIAGVLVALLVALLWQSYRRGGAFPFKALIAKGVIAGFFIAMTWGATQSTGGGIDGNMNPLKPGAMSPAWIVMNLNSTVSSIASAPAAALVDQPELSSASGKTDPANPLSCDNYVAALKDGYKAQYGNGPSKLSSSMPLLLSSMWEGTGLTTWRTAQYGNVHDPYATGVLMDQNTWCRQLEWSAGSKTVDQNADGGAAMSADMDNQSATVRGLMYRVLNQAGSGQTGLNIPYETAAFAPTSNDEQDRSLMAWTTCRLKQGSTNLASADSWTLAKVVDKGDVKQQASEQDCADWFTKTDGTGLDAFDWAGSSDGIQSRTQPSSGAPSAANLALRSYVRTLHGNDFVGGLTAASVYNISSVFNLAVFGVMALAVIFAKSMMVVMIVMIIFMLLMGLMPGQDLSKVLGFLKTLLGIDFYVFGTQLIFAIIMVITVVLQKAGVILGGDGSLMSIIWTGLSPIAAVVLIGLVFTKILKLPHPFKLSSALAWGSTASAVGGAALGGMSGLLERGHNGAAGALKSNSRRGLNAVLSKASGGRISGLPARKGAASAADATTPKAAKAAAAAAVNGGGKGKGPKFTNGSEMLGAKAAEAASLAAVGAPQASKGGNSRKDVAAALDPLAFAASGVANSQLAKGSMSKAERELMKAAQTTELNEAKKFDKEKRAELGIDDRSFGDKFDDAGANLTVAMTRLKNTAASFKDRGFKVTAGEMWASGQEGRDALRQDWKDDKKRVLAKAGKAAGKGAAVTGGAALTGFALGAMALPAAGLGAAAYGAVKGGKKLHGMLPSVANARNDQIVENYRQSNLQKQALEKKQEDEANRAAKAAKKVAKEQAKDGAQATSTPDGMSNGGAAHKGVGDHRVAVPTNVSGPRAK